MINPKPYPLSWPRSYPRVKFQTESHFIKPGRQTAPGQNSRSRRHTIEEARRFLYDELDRLGATEVVLSSNLILRSDNHPKGGQSQPADTAVCVYFNLKDKAVELPCDKWQHVECNIYAIGKHIESLRGQDRWGVGSIDRAFTGYLALEAQTQPKWFETLDVAEEAGIEIIKDARRLLVRRYHPDGTEPDQIKYNAIEEAFRFAMQIKDKNPT